MNTQLVYRNAVILSGALDVSRRDLEQIDEALAEIKTRGVNTQHDTSIRDLVDAVRSEIAEGKKAVTTLIEHGEKNARESQDEDADQYTAGLVRELDKMLSDFREHAQMIRALFDTMANEMSDEQNTKAVEVFESFNVSRQAESLIGCAALISELTDSLKRYADVK